METEIKKIDLLWKTKNILFKIPKLWWFERKFKKEIWNKIILNELITNNTIVDFFQKNEFQIFEKQQKFIKKDLISENEYYSSLISLKENIQRAQIEMRQEFVDAVIDIINKNTSVNVEDYLSLFVEFDNIDEQNIYIVTIEYYRNNLFNRSKKLFRNFILFCMLFFGIIIGLLIYLNIFQTNIL